MTDPQHKAKELIEWMPISEKMPKLNSSNYALDLLLKDGIRIRKGYYDGYMDKWFYYDKIGMSNECLPSHWYKK